MNRTRVRGFLTPGDAVNIITIILIRIILGAVPAVLGTTGGVFDTYVGQQFETMCMQWLFRESREGRLDFLPTSYGKWWGNDPSAREQTDIDIVMSDSINQQVLLGECKWRRSFDESEAVDKLITRSSLIKEKGERLYYLFTRNRVGDATALRSRAGAPLTFVDAESMFDPIV